MMLALLSDPDWTENTLNTNKMVTWQMLINQNIGKLLRIVTLAFMLLLSHHTLQQCFILDDGRMRTKDQSVSMYARRVTRHTHVILR